VVMEDATRQELTWRRLMVGVDLMARQWPDVLGGARRERIGVLLPNVNATPMVVLSLWAADKVPAVLNYSTGVGTMLACAQLSGLKRVITSRAFLDGAKLNVDPLVKSGIELIHIEDVSRAISVATRFFALLGHTLRPARFTQHAQPDDTAVILFTSGSEGAPKGVELSHANLIANIRQLILTTDVQDNDRLFNALPLFHSFGMTAGTLLPLVRGLYIFIYPSPLHYRVVPTMFYDRDCTIMLGTNTFLNG